MTLRWARVPGAELQGAEAAALAAARRDSDTICRTNSPLGQTAADRHCGQRSRPGGPQPPHCASLLKHSARAVSARERTRPSAPPRQSRVPFRILRASARRAAAPSDSRHVNNRRIDETVQLDWTQWCLRMYRCFRNYSRDSTVHYSTFSTPVYLQE